VRPPRGDGEQPGVQFTQGSPVILSCT
jgi:hypothetical protein